jgi:hypothetical protein
MFRAERASPPARRTISSTISGVRADLVEAPPNDGRELLGRKRLELVQLRPGEQRRIDLVVRVLGRRADQRHEAFLDRRQERVLLCLVEAVDLVEEENRPLARRAEPLPGAREHLANVLHRRRDGRELLERGARGGSDDPCERRLPRPRRPVEDRGAHAVVGDRRTQHRALAEHVGLADEFVERARPQTLRERCDVTRPLRRGVREEVCHGASMLRAWPYRAFAAR